MSTPPSEPAARAPLDSRVRVVTPENIAFEYRAAGPFARIGAYLIDLIILSLLLFGFTMLVQLIGAAASLSDLATMLMLIAWFGGQQFYCGLFEWLCNGQTPGKRMTSLRVLRIDGRPIAAWQAILRNLLRAVDLYPYIPMLVPFTEQTMEIVPTCLIGLTAMACTARHQRLGDLACNTMVIAEEPSGSGAAAKEWIDANGATRDPALSKVLDALPAGFRPTRSLAQALSHYANRRRRLGPARRQEIAKHVASPLAERLNLPADTDHDLLLCALYVRVFLNESESDEEFAIEGESPRSGTTESGLAESITDNSSPVDPMVGDSASPVPSP